ncbi:hypothetical protein [Dactylosporangium sp. CA-233914]|uniref:hypothetical protein n=1 Tax=Dactylosporangium sp. CA-233914 TaxID=3239934 RepID=UPI003D8EC481
MAIKTEATAGVAVEFGRYTAQTIAIDPVDPKVSRHALTVTASRAGWHIEPHNRNGVVLHLWAQPPRPLTRPETVLWPRIGCLMRGIDGGEHWILLDDTEAYTAPGSRATGTTATTDLPPPLTEAQLEAVRAVFDEILAWPPRVGARPRTLDAAAHRLKRSRSAIDLRLREVRKRAEGLGLRREPAIGDPEYIYVLARAGYLTPNATDPDS